jgi:membrane protease YdiL (CAAX protease family)
MSEKAIPDPKPVTASTPVEQTALPAEEEGLPSLQGMIFSPYLDPADLDGSNWDLRKDRPEMPPIDWDDPPLPEESQPGIGGDLLASEPEPAAELFAQAQQRTVPEPPRSSSMDWLPPAEKIAEKITPLGRPAVRSPHPRLYGNLADSTSITMDRPPSLKTREVKTGELKTGEVKTGEVKTGEEALPDQIPLLLNKAPAETSPREALQPASLAPRPPVLPALRILDVSHALPFSTDKKNAPQLLLPARSLSQGLAVVEKEPVARPPFPTADPEQIDSPLFRSFIRPEHTSPSQVRIPHLGHVGILGLLASVGLVGAGLLTRSALSFRLFGISTLQGAMSDVHYTIGSMAALYLIAFGAALLIFPLFWHRDYFAGIQWNGRSALRHLKSLFAAAGVCFVLALVDEVVLPGPSNAPIDKLFDTRTAAWLLFAFGVTFAPFFEETVFRGFLLPALSTAFDWSVERATGNPARPLDPLGHPQWSLGAMVFASIATSVPFALMHAEQTAWSLGPLLLLVAVSLVLSWARLSTRSLAASVLVHASYNFLLFSLMLLGTGGFRHLDKM